MLRRWTRPSRLGALVGAANPGEIIAEKGDQSPGIEGISGCVLVVESVDDQAEHRAIPLHRRPLGNSSLDADQ